MARGQGWDTEKERLATNPCHWQSFIHLTLESALCFLRRGTGEKGALEVVVPLLLSCYVKYSSRCLFQLDYAS